MWGGKEETAELDAASGAQLNSLGMELGKESSTKPPEKHGCG